MTSGVSMPAHVKDVTDRGCDQPVLNARVGAASRPHNNGSELTDHVRDRFSETVGPARRRITFCRADIEYEIDEVGDAAFGNGQVVAHRTTEPHSPAVGDFNDPYVVLRQGTSEVGPG